MLRTCGPGGGMVPLLAVTLGRADAAVGPVGLQQVGADGQRPSRVRRMDLMKSVASSLSKPTGPHSPSRAPSYPKVAPLGSETQPRADTNRTNPNSRPLDEFGCCGRD